MSPDKHKLSALGAVEKQSPVESKGTSVINGDIFKFYQVLWHTPSENTVDGVSFAMEAQFVHQLNDGALASGAGTYHRLAVIALLYELGNNTECNTFLTKIWGTFQAAAGDAIYLGDKKLVDFNAKLKDEVDNGYYHWMGSLTSPPCTEGVSWNLLKKAEKVCPAQVAKLATSLSTNQAGIAFNNRVTQPLNHRVVTELSALVSTSLVKSVTAAQWDRAIKMASQQRMLSQRMTKEFLFIAMNMAVTANTALCRQHITLFESNLRNLIHGSKDGLIPSAPVQRLLQAFYAVQFQWVIMKSNLLSNIDKIYTRSLLTPFTNVFEGLYSQNMLVLDASAAAVVEYFNAAKAAGVATAGLVVDVAGRQRTLTQKMSKECLFVGLNVHKAEILVTLSATMSLFEDSHRDIVRGVGSLPEMPELTDVCTLGKMKSVNGIWNRMAPHVSEIIDNQEANTKGLQEIMDLNVPLFTTMNEAVAMYTNTNNVCDLASEIKAEGWIKSLAEVGKQRVQTQKSITFFLQVVKGVQITASRASLTTALAEGSDSMRLSIEGSYYLDIPSPPTQAFVDTLMEAQNYWESLKTNIGNALLQSDLSNFGVTKTLSYTDSCLHEMEKVALMYVQATLDKMPTLRILVVEISWRQMILLQQMLKTALLVSIQEAAVANGLSYETSRTMFAASHQELLKGRVAGQSNAAHMLFPQLGFDGTSDACILTVMANVALQFENLDVTLFAVVKGPSVDDGHVAALGSAASALADALVTMLDAAGQYSTLQLTPDVCNTELIPAKWQSGIHNSGKPRQLLRQGQLDFYLLASGLAISWMADAATALTNHLSYIADDVESPTLEQALNAFINGWFEMGTSDVEREFNLKTAYITQNPHPLGSKLNLDQAPGRESYHAAHGVYHPIYRDILLRRNYYDIFIFDVTGNLVYSVYKELDFATNFEAAGDGEWKDSGLGEAYMKAKADPDNVHVIDWKPYGPSAGALASFLSKGIVGPAGLAVGVYSTQMPPESKPINCKQRLAQTSASMDALVENMKFGLPSDNLPPPARQSIAGAIFTMETQWQSVRATLLGANTVQAAQNVRVFDTSPYDALVRVYVDEAWAAMGSTVPGTKIMIANSQMARIQKIAADAVLYYMNPQLAEINALEVTPEEMAAQMLEFEEQHTILVSGRTGRRLQMMSTCP
jgi:carbonic anhydrase